GLALERRQPVDAGADDLDLPQHQVGHGGAAGGERRAEAAYRRRLHARRLFVLARAPRLLGGPRGPPGLKSLYPQLLRWPGVGAPSTALAAGLARTDWHASLENVYYDYWHVLSGVRYEPQNTAFITVDDATLVAFKDDPLAFWAPYWGEAFDVLTKAG